MTASLNTGRSVTLNAAGGGQVQLGPDSGYANWRIDTVIVQTSRPNVTPIPSVQLYLDTVDPANSLGLTPNGSFNQAGGTQELSRGRHIIAVWSGGQAGDVATMTVNGEAW